MQLVWQQRRITSKEQHSVMDAPVAGSRQMMQLTTVVLPFGKKEPEVCVLVIEMGRLHGLITLGGGKKAMPPPVPSHWTRMSVGQIIYGRH